MLEPSQFKVNEAWVAFQLNDLPICTEQDGNFNCVALMDAASGFILGTAFVSAGESEPSEFEVRRLFKSGWSHKKQHPATLFTPEGQFQTMLPAEAARHGITVVSVHESELAAFTGDAREGSTPIPRTLPSKLIMSKEECHGKAKKVQCGVQA